MYDVYMKKIVKMSLLSSISVSTEVILVEMCFCAAVIYETLMTVVNLHPNDALLSVASKCVGHFLSSKAANLQYIGNSISLFFSSCR